ncbi:MAG: hypothetical protein U0840_15440 [Gemmataceae bacterium]
MPRFVVTQRFDVPRAILFDVLCRPGNILAASPPDLGLELLEAPERLGPGVITRIRARRWGFATTIETEVIAWEEPVRIVEVQREGVLRAWTLERTWADDAPGTTLTETIDYEPPGGLLGQLLTAKAIEADLARAYQRREAWLREKLALGDSSMVSPGAGDAERPG